MLMLIYVNVLRIRNLYNICVKVSKHPNGLMMEGEMDDLRFYILFNTFQVYQNFKGREQWKSR